ncbi:protein NATD1 isoform X1 [Astyanax mexicanus]|uniref:protein NATD1 isoform X1 n=1 Tax=Astyanax mexicanus TaxID=7994 RepID=UPI0020CB1C31|nr:protein NATD1 isoform X1 [Astyanax mexicanus]XP_022527166.2 protein NATD1 isoform X1 [Astyanax mexicanus]
MRGWVGLSRAAGFPHVLPNRTGFYNPGPVHTLLRTTPTPARYCGTGTEPYRVIHNREQRCFTVSLRSGAGVVDSAVLKYQYSTDRHVHLLSTAVPESFRGKGVASHLAKAAMDFVVEEGLKATVSCWYIQKYVEENPGCGYEAHIED